MYLRTRLSKCSEIKQHIRAIGRVVGVKTGDIYTPTPNYARGMGVVSGVIYSILEWNAFAGII